MEQIVSKYLRIWIKLIGKICFEIQKAMLLRNSDDFIRIMQASI